MVENVRRNSICCRVFLISSLGFLISHMSMTSVVFSCSPLNLIICYRITLFMRPYCKYVCLGELSCVQIFDINSLFTLLEFRFCPVCVYFTFVFIIFMIHIDCYLVLTFLEGNCDFTTKLLLGTPWINIKLVAHVKGLQSALWFCHLPETLDIQISPIRPA